jgi:DNA-3-methyladenine glycosylase
MFGEPGFAYVYFTYGNHWILNITAHEPGRGAAILIRAAEPISGLDKMYSRRLTDEPKNLLSGPGKLCQAYGIGRKEYGIDLFSKESELRIELGSRVEKVVCGPRIGLTPGKGDYFCWRYADGNSLPWVSAKKSNLT